MGSTVGSNVNIVTKMCHATYSAVKKFITTGCNNNVSVDNKTHASIIAESLNIRDKNTMNCDRPTMNHL